MFLHNEEIIRCQTYLLYETVTFFEKKKDMLRKKTMSIPIHRFFFRLKLIFLAKFK